MEGLFFAGLICGRLWRGLLQGLVSAPARRGLLFCEEKWAKEFWGRICDRLAAGRTDYSFAKGSVTPTGEIKLLPFAGNPSVSLAADSLSLRLGHGATLICHWHIIHYRAATSLPLAQGSLWLGVASTTLSSKSRPGGRQEGRYCRSARYCSSRVSSWAAVSARMALGSAARSSAGVRLPQVISTVGRPRFLPREISTWESPT